VANVPRGVTNGTLPVSSPSQTITFGPLGDRLVDAHDAAPDFSVSATASSGLPVSFSSQTPSVCSVTSSGTVHLLATGTCTIRASQGGDEFYEPAPDVDQSFRVLRAVVMGPQAMEGDLKLTPGTTLSVGYDFTMPGNHQSATATFTSASVTFNVTCVGNSNTGTLTVPLPTASYADPAGSSAWYPSGDQESSSVYQGSLVVPSTICGAGVQVRFQHGGTFRSGITSTDTQDKISVRWHYSGGGSAGGWSGTSSVIPS
jgi:hypothetical protein